VPAAWVRACRLVAKTLAAQLSCACLEGEIDRQKFRSTKIKMPADGTTVAR
jgi:hypothetical protein